MSALSILSLKLPLPADQILTSKFINLADLSIFKTKTFVDKLVEQINKIFFINYTSSLR